MPARTLEDRSLAAEQRAWAREHGVEVPARGRLPAEVVKAWQAAHPGAPTDDDDDLEGDGADDPPGGPQAPADSLETPPPADDTEPGPPPPASLEEARARAGGERRLPPWASAGARRPRGQDRRPPKAPPKPPPRVTVAVRQDIEGKLALLLAIPAASWKAADPYCGGALTDNLDVIVAKAVPLICQSGDLVAWFLNTSKYMLLLDFMAACQPVAIAVYKHHVARTVQTDEKTGEVRPAAPAEESYPPVMYAAGHVPPVRPA